MIYLGTPCIINRAVDTGPLAVNTDHPIPFDKKVNDPLGCWNASTSEYASTGIPTNALITAPAGASFVAARGCHVGALSGGNSDGNSFTEIVMFRDDLAPTVSIAKASTAWIISTGGDVVEGHAILGIEPCLPGDKFYLRVRQEDGAGAATFIVADNPATTFGCWFY